MKQYLKAVTIALIVVGEARQAVATSVENYQQPIQTRSITEPRLESLPLVASHIVSRRDQPQVVPLPPGYTLESDANGVYSFKDSNGKRGFCDSKGKILIQPTDDEIRSVGDFRFIKTYYDDFHRVIELVGPGNSLIAQLPQGIRLEGEKYCDGLLRVRTDTEDVTGYLDRSGNFQIKPERFVRGKDFSSGFARVELIGHGYKMFTALINRNGKIVLGPFDEEKGYRVSEFWEGIAVVETESGEGILDKSLKYIVPPIYETIRSTNDNVYIAKRDDHWCVLSLKGKELKVFPKDVTNVRSENADGNWIYAVGGNPERANEVGYGQSPKESKEGVMSPAGKILIEPKYDRIVEYADGKAIVGSQNENRMLLGMVDSAGNILYPFEYEKLQLKNANTIEPVKARKNKFDADYFRKNTSNRFKQWHVFLEEFNLIGMDENEIYRHLGPPDQFADLDPKRPYPKQVTYTTLSGPCGNGWQGVRIEFDDNKKLSRWCFAHFGGQDGWNTDNVVFVKTQKGFSSIEGRLVPKNVAKEYE